MYQHECRVRKDDNTQTVMVSDKTALVGNRVYLGRSFWTIEAVHFPAVEVKTALEKHEAPKRFRPRASKR